jgi:hypothetical protein
MMHSPVIRFVGMAAWLISSLAAIAVGLKHLGYDYLGSGMLANYATPVAYVALVSGIIALVMFFLALGSKCACCGGAHTHAHK